MGEANAPPPFPTGLIELSVRPNRDFEPKRNLVNSLIMVVLSSSSRPEGALSSFRVQHLAPKV